MSMQIGTNAIFSNDSILRLLHLIVYIHGSVTSRQDGHGAVNDDMIRLQTFRTCIYLFKIQYVYPHYNSSNQGARLEAGRFTHTHTSHTFRRRRSLERTCTSAFLDSHLVDLLNRTVIVYVPFYLEMFKNNIL